MKLSKRLSAIYDLVDANTSLADIGSDHGKLAIELGKDKCDIVFCNDNKIGPFNILKNNVLESRLKNVEVSLSSGISALPDDIDTVVIAGMGGDLIVEILLNDKEKLKNIKTLILAPNTNEKEVRKEVVKLGYYIEKEVIVYEKHYYEIIKFQKGNKIYDDLDYEFGPILRRKKDEIFLRKYQEELDDLKRLLLNNLPIEKEKEIKDKIERIKSI